MAQTQAQFFAANPGATAADYSAYWAEQNPVKAARAAAQQIVTDVNTRLADITTQPAPTGGNVSSPAGDPMNWSRFGWTYKEVRVDPVTGNKEHVYVDADGVEHFGFAGAGTKPAATGATGASGTTTKTSQLTAAEERTQQNAIKALQSMFNTYNLQSLYTKIEQFVREGYNADTVALMLRETEEYKQRFPAMQTLAAKGRAISEASYIQYEQTAAHFEKQYGLPSGMLTGNVTKLLENDISAVEMQERVQMAAANSIMAPPELKTALQDYYGIGAGGLTAYFLDPAVAEPILQKQAAAAQLGAEAIRQDISLNLQTAEQLQQLGVTNAQAREGFQKTAGARELFSGVGDVTSEAEMVQGLLAGNQEALANLNRAAGSRRARFQQGGEYLTTSGGSVGLGSAATS